LIIAGILLHSTFHDLLRHLESAALMCASINRVWSKSTDRGGLKGLSGASPDPIF
jgi:hypothetical protein